MPKKILGVGCLWYDLETHGLANSLKIGQAVCQQKPSWLKAKGGLNCLKPAAEPASKWYGGAHY